MHICFNRSGRVRLSVYDVSGSRVATIVDEDMPKGRQRVTWDGRNDQGGVVASGAYFYKLVAGGQALTRKMMLLK